MANKIVAANVAPGQFTTTTRAGSSGTAVRAVQYYLRRLAAYYSDVPRVAVDGKFGAATTRAVKAWQSRAGLTVDGVVGRLTFQSLYDAAQALEASGPVVRTVSLPAPAATLRPGDTGAAVLRLNRLLLFLSQWRALRHISEPTRLRRISYAVFCLKKKTISVGLGHATEHDVIAKQLKGAEARQHGQRQT